MKMYNDLNHLDRLSYYRLYQEVQMAKREVRMNIRREISLQELQKDSRVKVEKNVMAPRKWGSNLDVIV